MSKQFQTFFSNRIELLFSRLKGELFAPSSTPFTRRLIIVPSPAMKSWLMLQMARDPDLGIATAIEVTYLDQAIKRLCRLYHPVANEPQPLQLSSMELALALEKEIRQIIQNTTKMTPQELALWQPLLTYLKIALTAGPHSLSSLSLPRKTERRLTALCEKLASLFAKYGTYGGPMVAEWETLADQDNEWQQKLWLRLFKLPLTTTSEATLWSYPYREITSLLQQPINLQHEHDLHVHLFSMSFLSRLQHSFLTHISAVIPVSYYLHSPCQAFWSDIKSDRESQWLQSFWKKQGASSAQQQDLESYLQDRNPLLANFGRLGREMARQIEESEVAQTIEDYELAEGISAHSQYENLYDDAIELRPTQHSLSLLEAIQADMALLRTPDSSHKISIENKDSTVQVHVAHTRMREVQTLYDSLLEIISKHAQEDSPICPGDIIVMAPDITLYTPYIRAVFDSKESLLNTQIMDISIPSHSTYVQAFLHLLALPFSRWDVTALLQLFDYPAFQKRHHLTREEVNTIREWVKSAGVRWGEDPQHRNELLKRDHCRQGMVEDSPIGTWEHAIERLLSGLVVNAAIDSEAMFSVENIDSTQSQLLGKWIALMRSLREDLSCLIDGTSLSLSEWSKYLCCLAESYFDSQAGKPVSQTEDYEILLSHIDAFKLAGQKIGTQPFPFSTIRHHLNASLQKQGESYREHDLHTVRFCSMLPMRAIPAQVIVMLGMEEGTFPRQQPILSLNLLQESKDADYCPSQTDYDRFLFLEALLSARRYFMITYQGFSAADGKEQPPSLLVTELLAYLDKSYSIDCKKPSETCLKKHPLHSFDSAYFSQGKGPFQSFSQENYRAAKAFYHAEKIPSACFVPEFTLSSCTTPSSDAISVNISLKDLIACAKNPIKTYFNKTLGIYLESEEKRIQKNEEDFHLSSLQSYLVKKEALKKSAEQIIQQAHREGKLPIGAFKDVAADKIRTDINAVQKNLTTLGIQPNSIFNITFSDQYQTPTQTEEGHWHLPPLKIRHLHITGTLHDVSPQGLITHTKDDKADILKAWPQFLVLSCLIKTHSLPIQNNLLLIKDKAKAKQPFFDDPQFLLEHYLDYYFTALKHVSPLVPEWIPHLLQDGSTFEATMRASLNPQFNRNYNEYMLWALQGAILPDSQTLVAHWQPRAEHLFGDLFRHW